MTTTAILFMVLAMVIVWGGLALSVLRLRADTRTHGEGAPDRPTDGVVVHPVDGPASPGPSAGP